MQTRWRRGLSVLIGSVILFFLIAGCQSNEREQTRDETDGDLENTSLENDFEPEILEEKEMEDGTEGICTCPEENDCCDGCHPFDDYLPCTPDVAEFGNCKVGLCASLSVSRIQLSGHAEQASIQSVAFSPDGLLLASANTPIIESDHPGEGILWRISDRSLLHKIETPMTSVGFTSDGTGVAFAGSTVTLRSLTDFTEISAPAEGTAPISFSRDGTLAATGKPEGILLWNVPDWTLKMEIPRPEEERSQQWGLAFSPDGQWIASGTGQQGLGSPHGDVRLYNTTDGTERIIGDCSCLSLAFSGDGSRLFTSCWSYLAVWDTADGTRLAQIWDMHSVMSVAVSPDDSYMVIGTLLGGVKFYQLAGFGEESQPEFVLPVYETKSIAFSPNGRQVAFGAWDNSVVDVWTLNLH